MRPVLKGTIALLLSVFAGCGYTFQGSGSILPPDIKKIYVPLVDNDSAETGISATVTEAIRDQFERYGVVSVVDTPAGADAVLKARILQVNRGTASVTSNTDTALQYDSTLVLAAELRRITGGVLWRNMGMSVSRQYGTTSGVVVATSPDFAAGNISAEDLGALSAREIARGQEQEAFDQLAEQAAKQIYDQAVAPDF